MQRTGITFQSTSRNDKNVNDRKNEQLSNYVIEKKKRKRRMSGWRTLKKKDKQQVRVHIKKYNY